MSDLMTPHETTVYLLKQRIEELEALAFTAYCAGYERAHNDTVEGCYSPPAEYPEEWAETRNELLANLLPIAALQENRYE